MTTVSVYVCPGSNQVVNADGSGGCTAGAGSWQAVTLADPFDPSTLNGSELAGAWGAGAVVMGTGACIAWAVAWVVKSVRDF